MRSTLLCTALVSAAALLLACSDAAVGTSGAGAGAGGGGGAGGASNSSSAASGGDAGAPPGPGLTGESFDVAIDVDGVSSGVENTQCVIKRLGNPEPIRVGRIRNAISNSSHHLIVYRTNDTEERLEPFDCDPFIDTLDPAAGAPLMVTQKLDDTLTLPEGVAFSLAADQMVRLELHYINTGVEPVDVTATSNFDVLADEAFEHEADFLFIGNPDIDIPAQSTATLGPVDFTLPGDLSGVSFFAITGHTHRWGTDVFVQTTDAGGAATAPVYDLDAFQWDEPETVVHDPPFNVPDGGGFEFTCSWNNQSEDRVGFGESANQEMCFFWAYYYPSKGAKVCFRSDQFPITVNECCPGGPLCSLIDDFLNGGL